MIDPMIWYSEREINIVPPHFFNCPSPVTPESLFWVHNKSNSRYVLVDSPQPSDNILSNDKLVYFEDQKDATMYELLWSGSK